MTATRRPRRRGPGWARTALRRAISTIRYANDELMRASEVIFRPAAVPQASASAARPRPPRPAQVEPTGPSDLEAGRPCTAPRSVERCRPRYRAAQVSQLTTLVKTRTGATGTAGSSRLAAAGAFAAYAAAILAFAYAAVSLYWTLGGRLLLATVGGFAEDIAHAGGVPAILLGLTTTAVKAGGGLLALALIRPWRRAIPRRLLLGCAAGASAVLTGYGGVLVAAGALALAGAVPTGGAADLTALRWHVAVWDLWFLAWGLLLTVATVARWREPRTASA